MQKRVPGPDNVMRILYMSGYYGVDFERLTAGRPQYYLRSRFPMNADG